MRGLSIRQPWAWLIAAGYKDIENRTWSTQYRGPLLIHATKKPPADISHLAPLLNYLGVELPTTFAQGGFVGVCYLAGCVNRSQSPWFEGDYGFVLREAQPLPFYPYRGRLGLFTVPPATLTDILATARR